MRILAMVTDAFGGRGGIAKFNRDFLEALCSHVSCEEVVAVPRVVFSDVGRLPNKLTYLTSVAGGKLRYVAGLAQLSFRPGRFGLLVCGHINLVPFATLLKRRLRVPVVLVIHGIEAWQPTERRLTNRWLRNVDAVLSVSETTRDRFYAWNEKARARCFIVPNCVDKELFGPGPKAPDLVARYGLEGKTVILTLGRLDSLERAKGFDEVIETLPRLCTEIPTLRYIIAGDGPDRARLERKAVSRRVQDRVIFTGYVSEQEKADHYRLAEAYVMPSRGEGFGIVLLEAMACGIPVVASSRDGSREAVRDGELGVVVDPLDPESLHSGILQALSRPRGIVPKGLNYFGLSRFKERVHRMIDAIAQPSTPRRA